MTQHPSTIAPGRTLRPVARNTWHWACTDENCGITRRSDQAATRHEELTGHRMEPADD
jgi:hypothetical protein